MSVLMLLLSLQHTTVADETLGGYKLLDCVDMANIPEHGKAA